MKEEWCCRVDDWLQSTVSTVRTRRKDGVWLGDLVRRLEGDWTQIQGVEDRPYKGTCGTDGTPHYSSEVGPEEGVQLGNEGS